MLDLKNITTDSSNPTNNLNNLNNHNNNDNNIKLENMKPYESQNINSQSIKKLLVPIRKKK